MTFAQAATTLLDALALTLFDAGHSELEEPWFTLGVSSEATRNERRQYENEPR